MAKRKIIRVDEDKCNGCGLCIPNCPEGALKVIDGKVRLVSELYCDGLGACIGHCPLGAITIEEREAQVYDERGVMGNIVKQGRNVIKAHLEHLKGHNQIEFFNQALTFLNEQGIENPLCAGLSEPNTQAAGGHQGCPGAQIIDFRGKKDG